MPFYKKEDDNIINGGDTVITPNAMLCVDNRDKLEYPQDGWYWFDNLDNAISFFADLSKPDSITPLQAELQLLKMELLDDVLELLKLDREAKIYWDRATQFLRYDPILLKMAGIIKMSDEKLDELFIDAKKIQ